MPYIALDEATAAAAFVTTEGAPRTSVGETLATLRTELAAQLGARDDVNPARLDKWINWAYLNVASMLEARELFGSHAITLVSGQPLYLLPIQVAAALALSRQDSTSDAWDGRPLDMIDLDTYRMLPEEDATATKWFRWRRMLVLYPTPDAALAVGLEFKVRPDPLVDETDSPLLPPEYHEAILLSARHRAWRSLMAYTQAQQAMNDFLVCIRPLQDMAAMERGHMPSSTFPARQSTQLYRRSR